MRVKITFLNKEFVGEFDGNNIFTDTPIDITSEFVGSDDLKDASFYSTDFMGILEKYEFVTILKYNHEI